MRNNTAGRHTFIMLAGVYLLYLSWQLFNGFCTGNTTNPVFLLAAILFAVIGVIIIVTNIRAIIRLSNEQQVEAENSENPEETAAEETAAEVSSEDVSASTASVTTADADSVSEEEAKES